MSWEWLTPVSALVGGALGAGATYRATRRDTIERGHDARRDTRLRDVQGRREEWGRRFTAALDDVVAADFRRRELGRVVLVQLASSDLADDEERALADAVLTAGALLDSQGDPTVIGAPGIAVDDVVVVEDDESDESEGSRP